MRHLLAIIVALVLTQPAAAAVLNNGTVQVEIDSSHGGLVKYLGPPNENYLNTFDYGRYMGPSVYDGADLYQYSPGHSDWGWNQLPANRLGDLNPIMDFKATAESIYIKAQLVDWNQTRRDNKLSDIIFEQWVSLDPANRAVLKFKYRLTHTGSDYHATRVQEMPYLYLTPKLNKLAGFGVNGQPVDFATFEDTYTGLPLKTIKAPEHWAAAFDADGFGLAIGGRDYQGFSYTWHDGQPDFKTHYLTPLLELGFPPFGVRELEFSIYVGRWQDAAQYFKALELPTPRPIEYTRTRLWQVAGTNLLYYITNSGYKRLMAPGKAALYSYGDIESDIAQVQPELVAPYPEIRLIKVPAEPAIYLIEGGQKRHIISWAVMKKRGYDRWPVAPVSKPELEAFPMAAEIRR